MAGPQRLGHTRQRALQQQANAAGAHIVGVQETRARRRINYHTETHLVYGAAANDKGQFGVQIWPDKTLPIGTVGEEKVYFADDQIKVVDSGPRYLILRIENKLLKLVLICAHGPHSQAAPADIHGFWQELRAAIPTRLRAWPVAGCFDAHAALGGVQTTAVGDYHAVEETFAGEQFHDFLQETAMWCPSTWEGAHEGDTGTWRHPGTGAWHRIDYVTLPQTWKTAQVCSYVEPDLDPTTVKEDHRATSVEIRQDNVQLAGQGAGHRRPAQPDLQQLRQALRGAERASFYEGYLEEEPWQMDVHSHYGRLTGAIQQAIQAQVRPSRRRKRKSYLADEVWELIDLKKEARKRLHALEKADKRARLRQILQAWRGAAPEQRPNLHYNIAQASVVLAMWCWCASTTCPLQRSLRARAFWLTMRTSSCLAIARRIWRRESPLAPSRRKSSRKRQRPFRQRPGSYMKRRPTC